MNVKVIADSCCEIPEKYKNDPRIEIIPLWLEIGDYRILDDKDFNQAEFLAQVAASPLVPHSACPSPDKYMEAMECDAENVFVVTLSAKLSGSYNSAVLGRSLYLEEHEGETPAKNIHIIDSKSAASGESQMLAKVLELAEEDMSFEEMRDALEAYRDSVTTFFVLDNLDVFKKNGRLTGIKSLVVSTLNIKLVCAGDDGVVVQAGQGIGIKKALIRMTQIARSKLTPEIAATRHLMITDVACPDRAAFCRRLMEEGGMKFREYSNMEARGVSSLYGCDGGIIMTY
ncbi:MAG: DegV family protein [Lachnospiraceae bacterium]|nr:DegV family protein [Lachnospiraceae bacterium]